MSYQLAGAGTRAAAYLIDILFMGLISILAQNLIVALVLMVARDMYAYLFAFLGVLSFILYNSYFIALELSWSGQSFGKRVVGIRVIKTGGYSLRFSDSLIRNLLRAIDSFPLVYGVGLTSLLLTPRCQRLGDLVAGTLVVYQQAWEQDAAIAPKKVAAPLSIVQLGMVPTDLVETCDEFLRARAALGPKHRQDIASELVDLVEHHSRLAPDKFQSAEAFLTQVVSQGEQTLPSSGMADL